MKRKDFNARTVDLQPMTQPDMCHERDNPRPEDECTGAQVISAIAQAVRHLDQNTRGSTPLYTSVELYNKTLRYCYERPLRMVSEQKSGIP